LPRNPVKGNLACLHHRLQVVLDLATHPLALILEGLEFGMDGVVVAPEELFAAVCHLAATTVSNHRGNEGGLRGRRPARMEGMGIQGGEWEVGMGWGCVSPTEANCKVARDLDHARLCASSHVAPVLVDREVALDDLVRHLLHCALDVANEVDWQRVATLASDRHRVLVEERIYSVQPPIDNGLVAHSMLDEVRIEPRTELLEAGL
jgi:hypothetical protein